MSSAEFFNVAKDVLVGAAALVTAIVAMLGLQNWNREVRGRANFDVARNLIRATYRLRDHMNSFRVPIYSGSEFPPGASRSPSKPDEDADTWMFVYNNRLEPVRTALQEFDAAALEAEALWGNEIRNRTDKMRECVAELRVAVMAVVSNKRSGGEDFSRDEQLGQKMRATVAVLPNDSMNPLSRRISEAVAAVEQEIVPHLRGGINSRQRRNLV